MSCIGTRSGTGSNEPVPVHVVHLAPVIESNEASAGTPRRKIGVKKKLTP